MSDFKYALNSSTIRPVPLLEKIRIAGEAGYAGIELWHDDIEAHLAQGGQLHDIVVALDEHNLRVPTTIHMKGWFESAGDEHTANMDACKWKMEQAEAVGAAYIIAGPPRETADRTLGAKNYRELLEIGHEIGIKPAMEFLGFVEDINSIEDALEIITHAEHPDGTIVLDPFHIFRGGGSIESIAQLSPAQIAICHFNDAPAQPPREQQADRDRVYPGDGSVDLKRMIALLKQIGYDGWLSLELFNEELWQQDPLEVAKTGLDKMRAVAEA
ncbi:sugar phosphate isomerase/epimerase [Symmachiella dynata]|uniref:sugar phosphate isomerase/epimerase family protein n=1 Tax=Symmachiella dynata TaxID=2527995 RepID=UPI0030EDDC5A